jgi:hypothetical protein
VLAGALESEVAPLDDALSLPVDGALGLGAALELSLLLGSLVAGALAASRMHCSFSLPLIDSQRAVLLGVVAPLLASPLALCVELCAIAAAENANAIIAASTFKFMMAPWL